MTIAAIPADVFVNSIPSVLAAAGTAPGTSGLIEDNSGDTSIPIGTVQVFPNQPAVAAWYGPNSIQALMATSYFGSFVGTTQIPATLLFSQYNTDPVAGYLRGGTVAGLTLSQLQALSGTISVVIDGVSHVSANANLASASSFTAAAALLQTALQTGAPTTTATVTYDTLRKAFVITSSTTGSSSSVGFGTDSSLSPSLNFTAATGAVLSPGAAAQTPASALGQVVKQTQNWASFTTVLDPDNGAAGGPVKILFSAWTNSTDGSYAYVGWDLDPTPSVTSGDSSCYAAQVLAGGYNGTIPLWAPNATAGAQKAAFILGAIASINFSQTNGRVDFAYLSQSGLVADVSDPTVFENLAGDGSSSDPGNGYNVYCVAATKTQQFTFLQWGTMPGVWRSISPYINQLYWNSVFQNDLLAWRASVKWVPYTTAGYNSIRQALQSDITQMGLFGAWVKGVTLSGSQIAEINQEAGADIASTLQNQGNYLQITDPGPVARAANLSPNIIFWYTDGGNVRKLTINSIDVQ